MFVPQQEAWIVERMGKFNRILDPGLNGETFYPWIDSCFEILMCLAKHMNNFCYFHGFKYGDEKT